MRTFKVAMYEVYKTTYLVEAEDMASAVQEIVERGGDVEEQEFLYEDVTLGVSTEVRPELAEIFPDRLTRCEVRDEEMIRGIAAVDELLADELDLSPK